MGILICALIGGCIGYLIGTSLNNPVKPPKVDIEQPMSTNEEENDTLTEEDANKVVAYALKQLKYNQNELQISTYSPDMGSKITDRNWKYYAFLDDLTIVIYVSDVARWEADSELSLLNSCVDKFIGGENPFEKIKVELRYGDETVYIEDWKTIEKFIDILYDTYFKMSFHKCVSLRRQEMKHIQEFCNERKKEIHKKIGIGK